MTRTTVPAPEGRVIISWEGQISFGNCLKTSVSVHMLLIRGSTAFFKFPKEAAYLLWVRLPDTPPHVWRRTHSSGLAPRAASISVPNTYPPYAIKPKLEVRGKNLEQGDAQVKEPRATPCRVPTLWRSGSTKKGRMENKSLDWAGIPGPQR